MHNDVKDSRNYIFEKIKQIPLKEQLFMPIFEYRCARCGKVYEELIFGDRDRNVPCPACGSDKTVKIPSVIGGITRGTSSASPCGSSCTSASACAASGGGCCPHAH